MILERFSHCPNIEICLLNLKTDNQLAVGLSRQHAMNHPLITRNEIFCFPPSENIYTYSVQMNAREDFNLLPRINELISRFIEHGFISRWIRRSQRTIFNIESHEPHPLTINHILGAMVSFAVGITLAMLTFVIESLYALLRKKQSAHTKLKMRPKKQPRHISRKSNKNPQKGYWTFYCICLSINAHFFSHQEAFDEFNYYKRVIGCSVNSQGFFQIMDVICAFVFLRNQIRF